MSIKNLQQKVFPYLMLLPTLVIFTLFLFYPLLNGFYLSFTQWDGLGKQTFIGLTNYAKLIQDNDFKISLLNTAGYAIITVPAIYISALALALLLSCKIRGSNLFRAIFYWPTMISGIIIGLSFRFLLSESFGLINYFLNLLGFKAVSWLTHPTLAMAVVIFVTVWSMAGYYMVMFIAGLKAISPTYYEAATLDGASPSAQFFNITLPLLKPISLLVLVLSTVAVVRSYPLVWALTQGGPAGSTRFVVQTIYETGFTRNQMGYASAMAIVLFGVLALLTLLQFKMNRGETENA